MKQDVILVLDCGATERAGDGRGSTRENYRPRRNGERQRHRGGKKRLAPVVAGGHYAALCRLLSADP